MIQQMRELKEVAGAGNGTVIIDLQAFEREMPASAETAGKSSKAANPSGGPLLFIKFWNWNIMEERKQRVQRVLQ